MDGFGSHLDGYHDVSNQMIDHLRRRAERCFQRRRAEREALKTRSAFEKYRARMRANFLHAIGGLPSERTPLNAKASGSIDRGQFTIEKVLYHSLPDFPVTASLYLPKSKKPSPAVLFVCGHAEEAKAHPGYQKVCAALAGDGFVVLSFDPLGQGERMQFIDERTGRQRVTWGTCEHTYSGIPFYAAGLSIARYFVWDGIRAIDYLCTRPEVNPKKIGVTGNSGGGMQTAYLMMAEPRLAAAMPCTFIMDYESYLKTGQPQDAEQNLYGCFSDGPDHDDFITAFAPRPVRLGLAAYDFFPLEGALASYERARRIYALYKAEENLDYTITPTTHTYGSHLRQSAVNFFRKSLRGEKENYKEDADPQALAPAELNVTERGQVLAGHVRENFGAAGFSSVYGGYRPFGGEELKGPTRPCTITDVLCAEFKTIISPMVRLSLFPPEMKEIIKQSDQAADVVVPKGLNAKFENALDNFSKAIAEIHAMVPTLRKKAPAKLRRELAEVLGIGENVPDGEACWIGPPRSRPIFPRIIEDRDSHGYRSEKLFFFSEPDVCVAGIFIHTREQKKKPPVTLVLLEEGTSGMRRHRARIAEELERGCNVFVFDVRGIGAVKTRPITSYSDDGPHGTEFRLACDAMKMKTSTLGLRVFDLLRAVDYMATRGDVGQITLLAQGRACAWALHAMALEPRIEVADLEGFYLSLRGMAQTRYYDTSLLNFQTIAFGLLRIADIAELFPAIAPRTLRFIASRSPSGALLSDSAIEREFMGSVRKAGLIGADPPQFR